LISLFAFGLGYSATAVARELKDRASIGGSVRTTEKASLLNEAGFEATVFDGARPGPAIRTALRHATHVLVSIAPGESGDPVLTHHRADIAAAADLRWIGYLSTVGVYGDYGGAWVSERTTPHPSRGRATARLEAEKAWLAAGQARDVAVAIFRIAGIYGPGRNAFVNLAEGKAHRIVKPGQVFNRIHVGDIAQTVANAAARLASGIYNLADDVPAPPQDVVSFAASLMGVAAPPEIQFDQAELSPLARSFYGDNRRVLNDRIKRELGIALRHPSYRDGLSAMWRDGTWPAGDDPGGNQSGGRRL
jgi:nucleoside-diphosphate-sugar epimerase